jgi:methylation protein EvaC
MIEKIKNCRNCKGELSDVIDFGRMPIANGFISKNDLDKEFFFNLNAVYCNKCTLFQLLENPKPSMMFHDSYAYYSGQSNYMQNHFSKLASKIDDQGRSNLKVIEIGNNDGGVIEYLYKKHNCIGIEPSENVANVAKSKGIKVINDYFNINTAKDVCSKFGFADYILSLNVLAHIPDINSVFEGISELINQNGIYITEDPYLLDMLHLLSYDQIYDEHIFIFSLTSISNIIEKFNLEVFDLQRVDTAGGSMRYFIGRKGKRKISKEVLEIQRYEDEMKLYSQQTYKKFKDGCYDSKNKLLKSLEIQRKNGKLLCSYGATSKSTTIFNFCKIDKNLISYITDTTPIKQNKLSPGMHIPIYDYTYFINNIPDTIFLAAWNLRQEIFNKEKLFKGNWISHIDHLF